MSPVGDIARRGQMRDETMTEEPQVTKVILTTVEELPVKQQIELGLTGRAVIEVSRNSPILKNPVRVEGTFTDYFEKKFSEGSLTPEEIRRLGSQF